MLIEILRGTDPRNIESEHRKYLAVHSNRIDPPRKIVLRVVSGRLEPGNTFIRLQHRSNQNHLVLCDS